MAANLDNGVILGALGSAHTDGTGAIVPPTGMIIAAIQFITKNTPTALVAEDADRFISIAHAANSLGAGSETTDEGSGGIAISGCEFPAGMTIYGRWTTATFAADSTGGVICYFGY